VSNSAQTAALDRAMFHDSHQRRGERAGARAMTTAAEYRGFAVDCFRWAEQASNASQRETLTDIARLWKNIAVKMDQYVTLAGDDDVRARELRSKLN
jgi:hypothetical protein